MEPSAGLDQAALVKRFFTSAEVDPFDQIEWETRDAWPDNPKYYNPGIEVPKSWSQNALNIVSKLYLARGTDYVEKSIRQLIERVAHAITLQGIASGYFGEFVEEDTEIHGEDALVFYDELCYILVNQLAAFNSPVWFNVGRPDRKWQVSACFILSVEDTTTSIMETAKREANIFRLGSGSGFDVSRLRGSMEPLSSGGTSSGPISFMRLWDAGAGTFKSGGTTRRAAKLVKCDVDHPDIRDFITCKMREEDRLEMLAKAGLHIGFDEEGERNVAEVTSFQNANNSVGATDEFMQAALATLEGDRIWPLIGRVRDELYVYDDASGLLDLISEAAWRCADPGMQYTDTINCWHTTPMLDGKPEPIRSSNPCGEFLSNDDTSCNLASINVLKFLWEKDEVQGFNVEGYRQAVDVMTTAMDILIELAHFPDEKIEDRTRKLRQLGLGYSNMGAAIMAQGLAYDSDEGRDFAAAVTALNTGRAYRQSARLAECLEPFHYFRENRDAMRAVMQKHVDALPTKLSKVDTPIWHAAEDDWLEVLDAGRMYGFRNAQASVLAPAGTISFFMDCDTTGVEPAFSLVTYKQLAGGGAMKLVNSSVERALVALGYHPEGDHDMAYIEETGYPDVLHEHKPVFASANEISVEGHIKMLAAVQPFVSGGISKTINMPNSATVNDIREAYVMAWRMGVKDLAIYRDGSKVRQVLMSKPKEVIVKDEPVVTSPSLTPQRRRLPRTRTGIIHKIHVRSSLGEHEGYISTGLYEDGSLGEIFLEGFGKSGGFTQNVLSAWATDFSLALQYGVPMEVLCRKHAFMADETGGMVVPPSEISDGMVPLRSCTSIVDYVARWLVAEFGDIDLQEELGVMTEAVKARKSESFDQSPDVISPVVLTISSNGHGTETVVGPSCRQCGAVTQRAGACWTCSSCGASTGCG